MDNLMNGKTLPPDIPMNVTIPDNNSNKVQENAPKFDKRNYLDFSIPEGQASRTLRLRLLPVNPETRELFQIVHMHSIKVNKELKPNAGGTKSYVCLYKNKNILEAKYGGKCPVCEEKNALWAQYKEETDPVKKEEIRKAAGSLDTREYCIMRCIERGKEDEGPKFWRFPLRKDNTDPFHVLMNLYETRRKEGMEAGVEVDIFSIYNGRDINVTFTNGTAAPTVMDVSIPTRLSNDDNTIIKWYYDDKKWHDVFGVKPYDYLKLAYDLEVPWFDKNSGRWVTKVEFDNAKNNTDAAEAAAIANAEAAYVSAPTMPAAPVTPAPSGYAPNPYPSVSSGMTGGVIPGDDDLPW